MLLVVIVVILLLVVIVVILLLVVVVVILVYWLSCSFVGYRFFRCSLVYWLGCCFVGYRFFRCSLVNRLGCRFVGYRFFRCSNIVIIIVVNVSGILIASRLDCSCVLVSSLCLSSRILVVVVVVIVVFVVIHSLCVVLILIILIVVIRHSLSCRVLVVVVVVVIFAVIHTLCVVFVSSILDLILLPFIGSSIPLAFSLVIVVYYIVFNRRIIRFLIDVVVIVDSSCSIISCNSRRWLSESCSHFGRRNLSCSCSRRLSCLGLLFIPLEKKLRIALSICYILLCRVPKRMLWLQLRFLRH